MSTIVTRAGKGSALTWAEADANFNNLNTDKLEKSGGLMTGALGVVAGAVGSPGIYASGDTNTGIYFPSADDIALTTGGVKGLEQDSSQRILVGGATATAQMNVQSATAARIALIAKGAASQSADVFAVHNSGGGLRAAISAVGNMALMGSTTDAAIGLKMGTGGERLDSTGNPYLISGTITNSLSGNVNGLYIDAISSFAGAISSITPFSSNITINNASNVVGTGSHFLLNSPTITAGGAITNQSGIKINAQKITGVTNGYSINSTGASDVAYFAGLMGIGTSTPHASAKLEVDGCIKIKVWTVGTLPTGVSGLRGMVSDALTPTFMTAVAAGGAVITPVYADGTTWKVG